MKWRVCKTVTEYHYFVVDAESEQEAMDIVNNHDEYYCDPANIDGADPSDMKIEVVNAVRIED